MSDSVQTSMDKSKYYISDDSEFHPTGDNHYWNAKNSIDKMIEIAHFWKYLVKSIVLRSEGIHSLKAVYLFEVSCTETSRIAILRTFHGNHDLRIQSYHHLRSNKIVHLMHDI